MKIIRQPLGRSRAGFTLIELLVSTSVAMILMFGATERIDASSSSDIPDVRYTSSSGSSAAEIATTEFRVDPRGIVSWPVSCGRAAAGVTAVQAKRMKATPSKRRRERITGVLQVKFVQIDP